MWGKRSLLSPLRGHPGFHGGAQRLHFLETHRTAHAVALRELIGLAAQPIEIVHGRLTADLRISADMLEIIAQERRQFPLRVSS